MNTYLSSNIPISEVFCVTKLISTAGGVYLVCSERVSCHTTGPVERNARVNRFGVHGTCAPMIA
jgi:hypothetical protein